MGNRAAHISLEGDGMVSLVLLDVIDYRIEKSREGRGAWMIVNRKTKKESERGNETYLGIPKQVVEAFDSSRGILE